MSHFISISGPSASGKSELFFELSNRSELKNALFIPDIFYSVWFDLVERGLLFEYEEINKDPEFLCIFIQKVIDKHRWDLSQYDDTDSLIILDSCWLDLSIYSYVNMWCSHSLKELQESLFSQINSLSTKVDKIYLTQYDESKSVKDKYHSRFKRYNIKLNRPLEIQGYNLSTNFKCVESLPSSDMIESANYILNDIRKLGYLE